VALATSGAGAPRPSLRLSSTTPIPAFTVLSQTWETGTSAAGHYGTNYRYRTTTGFDGSPAGEVEWRPNLPQAGTYQVAIYYRRAQTAQTMRRSPSTTPPARRHSPSPADRRRSVERARQLRIQRRHRRIRLAEQRRQRERVIADAVQFTLASGSVNLTMAVSPTGWGTTTPAVGARTPKL